MVTASWAVTMLLPTPPLPLTTPMTWRITEWGLQGSCRSWGWPQLWPQEEQSWVHSEESSWPQPAQF